MKQYCEEKDIRNYYFKLFDDQNMWYDLGDIQTKRENDDNKVKERFRNCSFYGCLTMEHGELAYCSRARNSDTGL